MKQEHSNDESETFQQSIVLADLERFRERVLGVVVAQVVGQRERWIFHPLKDTPEYLSRNLRATLAAENEYCIGELLDAVPELMSALTRYIDSDMYPSWQELVFDALTRHLDWLGNGNIPDAWSRWADSA